MYFCWYFECVTFEINLNTHLLNKNTLSNNVLYHLLCCCKNKTTKWLRRRMRSEKNNNIKKKMNSLLNIVRKFYYSFWSARFSFSFFPLFIRFASFTTEFFFCYFKHIIHIFIFIPTFLFYIEINDMTTQWKW